MENEKFKTTMIVWSYEKSIFIMDEETGGVLLIIHPNEWKPITKGWIEIDEHFLNDYI